LASIGHADVPVRSRLAGSVDPDASAGKARFSSNGHLPPFPNLDQASKDTSATALSLN
jgi:hypothetical protein